MIYNRIPAVFDNLRKITLASISYQFDVVQKLVITGLELPEYYQVDFCNEGDTSTITMVGTADGVDIPDQFLQTGRTVNAYLVITGTDTGAVETRYKITIPVEKRPTRTDIEPTPAEQSTIDTLIAAMNDAVSDAETSATAAFGFAENAEASADRAEQAAQSIDGKVERAEAAAQAAGVSATRAEDAEDAASLFASNAAESAEAAHLSEVSAEDSASTATTKAAEAEQSAAQAAASAASIEGDVEAAEQAAQQATQAATAASNSVTQAQGSATAASGSATVATNKAAEASASATTATNKATEAANSATAAQTAQTGAEAARTAAEAAQQAAEEAAQEAQTILVDKAPVITDTASGAIASFPDGADALPLKKLVASIDPVQDLHGYEYPWPDGGRNNLLPHTGTTQTINGVTITVDENGVITCNGTATAQVSFITGVFQAKEGVRYIYSGMPSDSQTSWYFLNLSPSPSNGMADTNYYSPSTITPIRDMDITSRLYIRSGRTVNNLVFKPMIRLESVSDDTYYPYSNICPISGWTGLEGQRTAINLFDKTAVEMSKYLDVVTGLPVSASAVYCVSDYILVKKGITVFIPATSTARRWYYNIKKEPVTYLNNLNGQAFTPPDDGYIRVSIKTDVVSIDTLQISFGTASTDYEQYQGESLSVSWQDTAGTVYGGTMTVNEDGSGELVVEYGRYAPTSFLNVWANNTNPDGTPVYLQIPNSTHNPIYIDPSKMTSNIFKYTPNGRRNAPLYSYCGNDGGPITYSFVLPLSITTLEEANAWLANNPTEITYKYEQDQVYHFDNLEQLSTILGTNNVWVDTGDVDVDYRADTKLYLEKLTAPTEDDLIADHAITSGSFFMIGNTLYKANTAIANGATITPGTNATQLSLADALNLLNT